MKVKSILLDASNRLVENRLTSITFELNKIQQDANSETKSSMGDKYETGRAMAQNEKTKLNQNKIIFLKHQQSLSKIKQSDAKTIEFGSVVETNNMNIFLSTAIGELLIDKKAYFAISPVTPLGNQLIGKKEGDSFTFNGQNWEITSVEN